MGSEKSEYVKESAEAPDDSPARDQFSLLDLFVLLSASAVAFSVGMPFLLKLDAAQWRWLLTLTAVQIGLIGSTFYFLKLRLRLRLASRQQMLAVAGSFIGKAECDLVNAGIMKRESRWFDFVQLVTLQSVLVWTTIAGAKIGASFMYMFSMMYGSFFTFSFICHVVVRDVRRMHQRIEFFEAGVSFDGVALIPWERVSVRPRKLQDTGIAVVYGDCRGFKNTVYVECSDATRKRLLERPV